MTHTLELRDNQLVYMDNRPIGISWNYTYEWNYPDTLPRELWSAQSLTGQRTEARTEQELLAKIQGWINPTERV